MALPSGVQESGGHMIDSDGVPVVRVDGAAGGAGASPTAIADAATASSSRYIGITVRETAGAAAVVRVRNNNVSGTILDTIPLAASEGVSYTYPQGRAAASGTVYVQVVSGTVEGSVFTA